jgi:hypothetical protein
MTSSGPDSPLSQAYRGVPRHYGGLRNAFQAPAPLDAAIENYDSLYHVLSTNVKTERTAAPHKETNV